MTCVGTSRSRRERIVPNASTFAFSCAIVSTNRAEKNTRPAATVVIAGYDFTFTQSGNLFQLIATSAIPEPSICATLAGMLTLALAALLRHSRT